MNFTKSLHTILFSIAIVLLFSGCGQEKQEEKIDDIPEANISNETVSKESLETFIFNDNFQSQEYYEMMKKNAVTVQANIVNQEVSQQKNPSSCSKLETILAQEQCRDNFFFQNAKTKKDITPCEQIEEKQLQEYCTNQIIKNNALESEDANVCNTIKNTLSQNECRNTVYIAIVRKTGNNEVCKEIKNKNTQEMCYNEAKFAQEEQIRIQKMEEKARKEKQERENAEIMTPEMDMMESMNTPT